MKDKLSIFGTTMFSVEIAEMLRWGQKLLTQYRRKLSRELMERGFKYQSHKRFQLNK